VRRRQKVYREAIQQRLANAGWHIDGGFSDYLVIGYDGDGLSLLSHEEAWRTGADPSFELLDHERNLTCWVGEIPTPQRAARLLQEHGKASPAKWYEL